MKEFDVIAVGIGLAGLTCAALLAKKGMRILYISQEADDFSIGTGPQNKDFPVCGYYYDIRSGVLRDILSELDLLSLVEYNTPAQICEIRINDFRFRCPSEWFEYRNQLMGLFPQYKNKIEEYFKTVYDLAEEWQMIIMSDEMPRFSVIPNMVKYQKIKYIDYLDSLFGDNLLKGILSVDIPYSQISFVVMAGYILQIFKSAYIVGGYQRIKNLLHKVITENNGEIIPDTKTLNIDEIMDERARYNVSISSIGQFKCRSIVFDYDKYSYKGIRNIESEQVIHIEGRSSNAFVNLECKSLNRKDGYPQIIKYFSNSDIKKFFLDLECGCQPENYAFTLHFPLQDNVDSEYSSIQFEVPVPVNFAKEEIDRVIKKVLEIAEIEFPEIVGQIISQCTIYPQDIENKLYLTRGIQSNWAFSPDEIKKNPINIKPVLPGIYLAGEWGKAFVASGKILAKAISKKDF